MPSRTELQGLLVDRSDEQPAGHRKQGCFCKVGVTNRGWVLPAALAQCYELFMMQVLTSCRRANTCYHVAISCHLDQRIKMNFLPRISRYPAPHGVLNTTINCVSWFTSCSLGQSVSRFSVTVCRRHLSLLPNSFHHLIKEILPHHNVYQPLCLRTVSSCIGEATKTLISSRSGLPTSQQRWFNTGSSCLSNDLPTIVKIVRPYSVLDYIICSLVPRLKLSVQH